MNLKNSTSKDLKNRTCMNLKQLATPATGDNYDGLGPNKTVEKRGHTDIQFFF